MNLSKINHYAKYSQETHRVNSHNRNYQLFNPHTSELYEMKALFSKQATTSGKDFYLIQLDNICRWSAGSMYKVGANWYQHHRSFVLGMLKGALKISFCKSYKDAKRLSNLGGRVVCIKNEGSAVQWGVVK